MNTNTMKLAVEIEAKVAQANKAVESFVARIKSVDKAANARAAAARKQSQEEQDMAALGIRSNKQIREEIDRITSALQRLRTSEATAWSGEMTRASQAAETKLASLHAEMNGTAQQTEQLTQRSGMLSTAWGKLTAVWVSFQAILAAGGVIGLVEDMQRLDSRLQSTEGSSRRAAVAMAVIEQIAQDTGTPIRSVADAYVKFSNASQRVGGTQQQTLKFTEALTKALVNSGASAETSGIVMQQLGQAFDANRLAGDEFKSVAENAGKVLDYLAAALGVSRGELRKMSEDGQLTADKLLKLGEASDLINKDFEKMPRTVGQSVTKIVNAFAIWGAKNEVVRATLSGLATVLEFVAKNLGKVLATAVVATMGAWIIAVGGVSAAMGLLEATALKAGAALSLLSKNPWVIAITVAITALIWLWDEFAGAVQGLSFTSVDELKDDLTDLEVRLNGIATKVKPALDEITKALTDIRKETEKSGEALERAYATQTDQVEQETAEQIRLVKQRYEEEKRKIQETQGSSDSRYQAEAAALVRSTEEQSRILRESMTGRLALLDQEYAVRKDIALRMVDTDRERKQLALELDNQLLAKKRSVLGQMLSDYREHINSLNAEAQRHLDAVRQIEDQKQQLTMSVEDKIRAIRQSTMGEYQAYQDKLRQLDELTSKGRQALAAGDSQRAEEYFKKVIDGAAQSARAVSENGQEMVSQRAAAATAISKITEAERLAQQAMDSRMAAHSQAAQTQQQEALSLQTTMASLSAQWQEISNQLSQGVQLTITTNMAQVQEDLQKLDALIQQREVLLMIKSNVDELQSKVKAMQSQLEEGTVSEHEIRDNANQVQKELSALDGRVTESTHIIHVKRVEGNAAGGWAGEAVRYLASGGAAWKRITGRVFGPGTTTSDSIRAMLSRDEFVVRAKATNVVSRMFPGFMEAFNAISNPADLAKLLNGVASAFAAPQVRLAGGGYPTQMLAAGAGTGFSREFLDVNFRVGESEVPVRVARTDKALVQQLVKELNRQGLVAGS